MAEAIRAICQPISSRHSPPIPTGITPLDAAIPHHGLDRGLVHEWIGLIDAEPPAGSSRQRRSHWSPPLALLIHLGRQALLAPDLSAAHLVWIGSPVWPYLPALAAPSNVRAISQSLFLRADRPADRLWAADLALRSHAAAAVIADGSNFDLAATRRLQLAAEAGGSICLLARPPWERAALSAAATRWLVRSVPSASDAPQWTVELLRCKGVQPTPGAPRLWTLERSHATHTVAVVPDILDGPDRTKTGEIAPRRTG